MSCDWGEDLDSKTPVRVSHIKNLLLVLDGYFDAKEVEHLVIAGWDNVFIRTKWTNYLIPFS
jgi:hypothetical protein